MHGVSRRARRDFLRQFAVVGGGLALPVSALAAGGRGEEEKAEGEHEEEITPTEDLMREHGVLNRVLLVYEEGLRRIDEGEELPPEALRKAAGIVRTFIEDYHEKNEENYLFPRFEKAHKLVELVTVLRAQHQAGRELTGSIERLATLESIRNEARRSELSEAMRLFIRMYRPHEAREDTVLFPALRTIVSAHEYAALGEDFEGREHELLGEDGFEKMVDTVAGIEKTLGIYNLAKFTPPAAKAKTK
jgi:hemerythrin-like domain-containing protein